MNSCYIVWFNFLALVASIHFFTLYYSAIMNTKIIKQSSINNYKNMRVNTSNKSHHKVAANKMQFLKCNWWRAKKDVKVPEIMVEQRKSLNHWFDIARNTALGLKVTVQELHWQMIYHGIKEGDREYDNACAEWWRNVTQKCCIAVRSTWVGLYWSLEG